MSWKVGVVLDNGTNLASLQILLGQMPVWALDTTERRDALRALNEEFKLFWIPEPAFTVYTDYLPEDRISTLLNLVPTIGEHHPNLTGLHLIGIESSTELLSGLSALGYERVPDPNAVYPDRLRFAMPLSQIPSIPEIVLDANGWKEFGDFYAAFFAAVGAPDWHGRDPNALNDSIEGCGINRIEVPYRIVIRNADKMGSTAAGEVNDFQAVIAHIRNDGCPVDLVIEPS